MREREKNVRQIESKIGCGKGTVAEVARISLLLSTKGSPTAEGETKGKWDRERSLFVLLHAVMCSSGR